KAKHAKSCALVSFLNMSAVVDYVSKMDEDLYIVCSGKHSNICLEDVVCAGMFLSKLPKTLGKELEGLGDPGQISIDLFKHYLASTGRVSNKAIHEMLENSEHGQYLKSIGFEGDIDICSRLDSLPFVPLFRNGLIK